MATQTQSKIILKYLKVFYFHYFELAFWIVAISLLFTLDTSQSHYSLCLFRNLGWDFCPGCGLGRSCALALNGRFIDSFYMHPFGIFALVVIFLRIVRLIRNRFDHKIKIS